MATIRKRGDKWQVQIRRKGEVPFSRTFGLRRDADIWARMVETQADRKDLPKDPRLLGQHTLGELVVRYRDTVSVKKRGKEMEQWVLNAFLRHSLCVRSLSNITAIDFTAYRDERLQEIKPNSLKRQLDVIHNLFEVARDEWGLPFKENPLDKIRLDCTDTRRERRLRPGEFERLVDACGLCRNPYVLPIIKLAIETGMRRGEILAIQWHDIDIREQSLTIPRSKNGRSRHIPLTSKAIAIIQGVEKVGDRVFPVTANGFRLAWQRVKTRARIEDLHFHDLRHEAISRFFELGLTTPEVALISGHRDMRMLFRYAHAMRSQISEKLDQRSGGAVRVSRERTSHAQGKQKGYMN